MDHVIERHRENDAHGRDEQPVNRITQCLAQLHGIIEHRRNRDAMDVVVDENAAQLLEDEDQPVGQQHLLQMIALVELREQRPLEKQAEQDGQHDPKDDGDK